MDSKDFQLLVALHKNARQSYTSFRRSTSLSAPAVRERLNRLESSGVVHGYGLWIEPSVFGRDEVLVFFRHERTHAQVLDALAAPDVAWIGWKLEGGLTVALWSLDTDRSVKQLVSVLGERPIGRALAP